MFRLFTKAISNALGFSRVEARGTLMLIFVMILSISFARVYVHMVKNPTAQEADHFDDLEAWVAEVEASYELRSATPKPVYRPTSPNAAQKKFPTDLDYGRGDSRLATKNTHVHASDPDEIVVQDLNTATEEALQQIKGIGPSYSRRIVKFRELLGGFHDKSQLNEVYGLPEEAVSAVQKSFSVLSPPRRIKINSDSAKILAAHPYITYDLAWIIINFRKHNGDIASSEDLRKIQAIDEETFTRLQPYLD